MNFIIDQNLPRRMADALRARGHGAWHSAELVGRAAEDDVIRREAVTRACIVISEDSDFAARAGGPPPDAAVIWLRLGTCTTDDAVRLILAMLDDITAALQAGERLVVL